MTIHLGDVLASTTLYIPFASYDSNGASVTLTGLATGDIKIYKNGSTTERASANGYTLLDTDGIDFDGVTGLHGFSVDLSDNTTAGFFAAGSFYWVVVSTVTIDSQTITLIAATFRITEASDISDVLSLLTLVRSDTTHIESDAAHVESDAAHIESDVISNATRIQQIQSDVISNATRDTTIASNVLIIKSDTSDIRSNLAVIEGAAGFLSDIQSDTNKLVSDQLSQFTVINAIISDIQSDTNVIITKLTEVDTSDIQSLLTKVYSDTTAGFGGGGSGLSSDQDSKLTRVANAIVEVDTSDLMSMLTLIRSDTTHIESDQASQFTLIRSDTAHIESDAVRILSDTTHIDSDTTHIESDCAADQIVLSDVQSDTNKLVSDATEIDTSDIHSLLTLVRSDTTVVEAFGAPPAAASIAAAVLAVAYEGAETVQHFFRLARAVLYGKASGMNGPSAAFRDKTDAKDRVVAAVDGGDRDTPTLDPS